MLYQAEALYNLCQFEYSLLGYHRATRLAPDSEPAQQGRYSRALFSLVQLLHYCALIGQELKGPEALAGSLWVMA